MAMILGFITGTLIYNAINNDWNLARSIIVTLSCTIVYGIIKLIKEINKPEGKL